MSAKAPAAGWVVQVTVASSPPPSSKEGARWIGEKMPDAPSFYYFNVAIANPDNAVEATRKYLAKGKVDEEDVVASTVRGLSSSEVAALRLKAGEVKPA